MVVFDDGDYLVDAFIEEIRIPKHPMVITGDSLLEFIAVQNIDPHEHDISHPIENNVNNHTEVGDSLQNVEAFLRPAIFQAMKQGLTANPRQKLDALLATTRWN